VALVNLRRLFKDYRESGALHQLISIQSSVGGGVFVTKSGDLMMFLSLRGSGRECIDPGETDHVQPALRIGATRS